MKTLRSLALAAAAAAALGAVSPAHAALTAFQTFVGKYGVSTDGWGSTTQRGVISANVPVGATVVGAYLYTSTFSNPTLSGVGGTLNGNALAYTNLGVASDSCCDLAAGRVNVTSIIKPLVDGGPGGLYNFNITETSASQDGSALVVVYQLNSLDISTVGILDGFSQTAGDATAINFAQPLDKTAPGFFAEMRLGIGFSCCNQQSTITVNGTVITNTAGNNDDSADPSLGNGNLITMGGDDDAFSPMLPAYGNDNERYNLVPQITNGDTSIAIRTNNPSRNDNIFVAVFHVAGEAGVNTPPPNRVPEPGSLALVGLALLGFAANQRRNARK